MNVQSTEVQKTKGIIYLSFSYVNQVQFFEMKGSSESKLFITFNRVRDIGLLVLILF